MMQIAILGAGGLARETAWLIEECSSDRVPLEVVCFIDKQESHGGGSINGFPVFTWDETRVRFPSAHVVSGVGTPSLRRRLIEEIELAGFRSPILVHPRVERSKWVEIGAGSVICAGTIMTTNIVIGRHVHVNLDCTIGHDVVMEDYATLTPGVHVSGCVHIRKGAYIGTGANIINGTSDKPLIIGEWAVVAAGACVVSDVGAGMTVFGVPAKPK